MFPWLVNELRAERAKTLCLLGDLTDAKDYHPAQLVNRVVAAIKLLRTTVPRIIILRGNHDYLKDGHMFFEFLNAIDGVEVITKPTEDLTDGAAALFLPYSKTPAADWKDLTDLSHFNYVFLHQTIKGAVASNGQKMDGDQLPDFAGAKVYSGDIHVPQVIGGIEYVGSPYHVHFGDRFTPRVIAIDRDHKAFDLRFPCISRVTLDVDGVEGLRRVQLNEGDQVKLRIHLPESDKHAWREVRREALDLCDFARVDLQGLELVVKKTRRRAVVGAPAIVKASPEEVLYRFVEADDLGGELLDAGLECLE